MLTVVTGRCTNPAKNGSRVYGPCPEKNPRCACKRPTDITTEALQRIGELYAIEERSGDVQQNNVWRQEKPELRTDAVTV